MHRLENKQKIERKKRGGNQPQTHFLSFCTFQCITSRLCFLGMIHKADSCASDSRYSTGGGFGSCKASAECGKISSSLTPQ